MTFKMKYAIKKDYLPLVIKGRRTGIKASKIKFVVLHDVGNDGNNKNGTTAAGNINYYKNSKNVEASAHTFIDDKEILECIPAVTGTPEKAWHVLYNKTIDNKMYGVDANDSAIGVELCYYPKDAARSKAAYDKYVWYCAYLAYHFGLDPAKCFVGHEVLDPGRKSDPSNGLRWIGKNTNQCIKDIQAEYNACLGKVAAAVTQTTAIKETHKPIGTVTVKVASLNVRKSDNVTSAVVKQLEQGKSYKVYGVGSWGYNVGAGWVSKGSQYVTFTKQ